MPVRFRPWLLACALALPALLTACVTQEVSPPRAAVPTKNVARSDLLWHFVHDQCVPNQVAGKRPPLPCIKVDMDHGYVIFKDKNGPLQYLYMPTGKISGLEDPALQTAKRTPYFSQAWQARRYMDRLLGKPIALHEYSFTVNSKSGRSQNHLHIHISCVRPALRDRLLAVSSTFNDKWHSIARGINGRAYQVRTVSLDELQQRGAIALVIATLPGAKQNMDNISLAMYPVTERQFLLFAANQPGASAERDFQDHACPQLLGNKERM